MLSLTKISCGGATQYYQTAGGEYYEKGAKVNEWHGEVAKELGLTEKEFDFKDFDKLIKGFDLDDKKLVKSAGGKDHRAGLDLTFGVAKSVSLMAMVDPRIKEAALEAVKETLDYLEKNYVSTRVMENGEKRVEETGKMLTAIFEHHTNRLIDPHLHFHAVLVNLTKDLNGNYKTIHNDKIFIDQKHLGLTFRANLAPKLIDLGYDLEITNRKEGFFEIKGIINEIIRHYSRRQQEVEERKGELQKLYPNARPGKLSEMAALDTRLPKAQELSKEELQNTVNNGLENFSSSLHELETNAMISGKRAVPVPTNLEQVIKESIQGLEENKSAWRMVELVDQTIKMTLGDHSPDQIYKEVNEFIKSDQISYVGTKKNMEYFATKEMQKIESKVIDQVKEGKNKSDIFISDKNAAKIIESNPTLTLGQKDALNLILTSKDRIIGVQGDAGTGKTYVMDAVRETLEKNGFNVRGLAPTGKAETELKSGAHLKKSETIDSFLLKATNKNFINQITPKREVWIIDEAGMVGSKKMERLLATALEVKAKVVLTGDIKQFLSIDQGKIFADLQKEGSLVFAIMKDGVRQKTEETRAIVKGFNEFITSGRNTLHLKDAFDVLKSSNKITEFSKEDFKINAIKEEYLNSDKSKSVLIITSTNKERDTLNGSIRMALKDKVRIDPDGFIFKTFNSVGFSGTSKMLADNYKEKQVVFFEKTYGNIKKGTQGIITKIDKNKNELIIGQFDKKHPDRQVAVSLKSLKDLAKIQVFNREKKEFSIGDKVIFNKNDDLLGVKNGQMGVIEKINESGKCTVEMDKKKITFNLSGTGLKPYQYIDHAYALTEYKSQGATVDKLIWLADSKTASYNSAYVAVTRAKEDIKIFTDNIALLEKNVARESSKISSLELKRGGNQINRTTERELFNIPPSSKDIEEIDFSKNINRGIER
ncbi:MAG: relaxase domain-containing protein [Oligoflexia bacterium]|nr:relaxase domain-containing protein [Oligoflexia bacterium]